MQVNNQTRPVTMTLPKLLIKRIDELAGPDRRSRFVTDVLRDYFASQETQPERHDVNCKFDTRRQQTS